MYCADLLTVAKTWKQSQCPSIDEWVKKRCGTYLYLSIYIYTCIYIYIYLYAHTHTHTYNGIMHLCISCFNGCLILGAMYVPVLLAILFLIDILLFLFSFLKFYFTFRYQYPNCDGDYMNPLMCQNLKNATKSILLYVDLKNKIIKEGIESLHSLTFCIPVKLG